MGGVERINQFIQEKGFYFEVSEHDVDSGFHTVRTNDGGKVWYKLVNSGDLIACFFGDWRSGENHKCYSKDAATADEKRNVKKWLKQLDEEREERYLVAKGLAEELWVKFQREAFKENSHYLEGKKLTPSDGCLVVRGDTDNQRVLVIPCFDEAGELWNIQQVYRAGGKYFNKSARTAGLFHVIRGTTEKVYVGEGYATCRAFNQATGATVYVAFSAKNLEAVLRVAIRNHGGPVNVQLLADWDGEAFEKTGKNTGMFECQVLAVKHRVLVCCPINLGEEHPNKKIDFADLWDWGEWSVKTISWERLSQFTFKIEKEKPKKDVVVKENKGREEQTESVDGEENAEGHGASHAESKGSRCEYSISTDLAAEQETEWLPNYDAICAEIMPDRGDKGKVLGTLRNFQSLMTFVGATLRYNLIKKEQEVMIPGEVLSVDNYNNALHGRIMDLCVRASYPRAEVDGYLAYLCDQKQFNPVVTWIESKPWDGVSRLEDLYSTLTVEHEDEDVEAKRMKGVLIRKWMLTAIAGVYRPHGVAAPGMLVLQGAQGSGKTAWFNALVPQALGLTTESKVLNPEDKDSVKQTVCFWLVELGELNATFKKSELEGLKAFLTKQWDMFRAAYARHESKFPRRTVFFGSVNDEHFLIDDTGNRRFWVLPVVGIDYEHQLDMQQIWAELAAQFKKGAEWWLDAAEFAWLNESNKKFESLDPMEEKLLQRFDWTRHGRDMTATELAQEIGYSMPSRRDLNVIAAKARKLSQGQKVQRRKGAKLLWTGMKK